MCDTEAQNIPKAEPAVGRWISRHPILGIVLTNVVIWSIAILTAWAIPNPIIAIAPIAIGVSAVFSNAALPNWPSSTSKLLAVIMAGKICATVLILAYVRITKHPAGTAIADENNTLEMVAALAALYAALLSLIYLTISFCEVMARRNQKDRSN